MTVPAAPMESDHSSATSRSRPHLVKDSGDVRVEGVPPSGVVVRAGSTIHGHWITAGARGPGRAVVWFRGRPAWHFTLADHPHIVPVPRGGDNGAGHLTDAHAGATFAARRALSAHPACRSRLGRRG